MKHGWMAIAVAAIALAAPARAEVVDMASITCGDLKTMKDDDAGAILLWLHGYYAGRNEETRFDLKEFEKAAKKIGSYCAKNAKVTLLSAAKDAME
ncbi:MAG: HdeA/HdeB family chaperone [Reyranellaceae bacterium]